MVRTKGGNGRFRRRRQGQKDSTVVGVHVPKNRRRTALHTPYYLLKLAMLLFAPLFLVAAAQMLPLASRLRPIILAGRAPAKIVGKVARTTVKAATRKSTSDLLDMHAESIVRALRKHFSAECCVLYSSRHMCVRNHPLRS